MVRAPLTVADQRRTCTGFPSGAVLPQLSELRASRYHGGIGRLPRKPHPGPPVPLTGMLHGLGGVRSTRMRDWMGRRAMAGQVRALVGAVIVVGGVVGTLGLTVPTGAAPGPTTLASWSPQPASYGIGTKFDLPVTMADGTVLRANEYYPTTGGKPAGGPFPVLLQQTPYGKAFIAAGGALAGTDTATWSTGATSWCIVRRPRHRRLRRHLRVCSTRCSRRRGHPGPMGVDAAPTPTARSGSSASPTWASTSSRRSGAAPANIADEGHVPDHRRQRPLRRHRDPGRHARRRVLRRLPGPGERRSTWPTRCSNRSSRRLRAATRQCSPTRWPPDADGGGPQLHAGVVPAQLLVNIETGQGDSAFDGAYWQAAQPGRRPGRRGRRPHPRLPGGRLERPVPGRRAPQLRRPAEPL